MANATVSSSRARLSYQPALDGIRAVAVVAVMVFHGGLGWLPGGYLGVDLFFVLSGYLITTLLLREYAGTGGIALVDFWGRRIRRLFPALLLLIAAVAVYGGFVAPAVTRESLRWDGLASLFYVANWRFIFSHQSYFAGFAVTSPLRHVWSLAVEEQWYLFWPPFLLLMLGVFRRNVRRLLWVVVPLTLASAGWMAYLDESTRGAADAARSYYGTDTHAQVLLVGAVLAILLHEWPVRRGRTRQRVRAAGVAGAAYVGAMFLVAHGTDRWMYRGGFLAFAIAGAAVIAAVMMPGKRWMSSALGFEPLPWIGRISYGLYLWHWPVDVYLNPTRVHLSPYPLFALRTAVALAITVASYYLVELPIRSRRVQFPKPLRVLAGATAVCTLAITLLPRFGPLPGGAQVASASLPAPPPGRPVRVPPVTAPPTTVQQVETLPPVPQGQTVKVMVVGDSVGWTLAWEQGRETPGLRVIDRAMIGCGLTAGVPVIDGQPHSEAAQPCGKWKQVWLGGLQSEPDIVAVSAGAWEVYDQQFGDRRYKVFTPEYRALLEQQFQYDINLIESYSHARIVIFDVPCFKENDYGLGGPAGARNDPKRVEWVNGVIRDVVAQNPGRVELLPISELVCPNGHFVEDHDGMVLRPDGVHYSVASAAYAWQWLAPRLLAMVHRPWTAPAEAGPPPSVDDPSAPFEGIGSPSS